MPKKKPGKHLRFYMDCMETGKMPYCGLCICADEELISSSLLKLLDPSFELYNTTIHHYLFWASGSEKSMAWQFTTLRQTIVLLMACLNNEL